VEWLKTLGYDMQTISELEDGRIEMPCIDVGMLSRNRIDEKKVLTYYDEHDMMITVGGNGE
jgi:hypothetical protein